MNAKHSAEQARHRRRNDVLRLLIKNPPPAISAMLWAEINAGSGEVNWEQVDAGLASPWIGGDLCDDAFDFGINDVLAADAGDDDDIGWEALK